jgi:elongation factor G
MAKAAPVVLEPVSLVKVQVPGPFQGDVMGDINSRRGRVLGTETVGEGVQEVTAHIPTAEIMRYAIDLRSMTGGRASFVAEHSHYDLLPAHLVDKARAALASGSSH